MVCAAGRLDWTRVVRSAWGVTALVGLGLASAAAAPSISAGAMVSLSSDGGATRVDYRAASGEQNRVEIVRVDLQTIRVSDGGAVIATSGTGCRSIDAHSVECVDGEVGSPAFGQLFLVDVLVGDMDDEVRAHEAVLVANGGPGNDTLVASPGRCSGPPNIGVGCESTLNGGGGRDTLLGGIGTDAIADGDTTGAADADFIDGGGGRFDSVTYATRTAPIRMDLGIAGRAGESGEGDILRGIEEVEGGSASDDLRAGRERVTFRGGPGADRLRAGRERVTFRGGPGADRLVGGPKRDFLVGGPGADHLIGHAGTDGLIGGPGGDTLLGGAGADRLAAGGGRDNLYGGASSDRLWSGPGADRVSCGPPGRDEVRQPIAREFMPPDCEIARFGQRQGGLHVVTYPSSRDGASATFEISCHHAALVGRISIRERFGTKRHLGSRDLPVALGRGCQNGGTEVSVRVTLNALGRALVSRSDGVRATASVRAQGLSPARWTIRLAIPDSGSRGTDVR